MFARPLVELVANDGPSMRDESSDKVLLESESQIQIGPGLVPVLKHRHAKDKVVEVFQVAIPFALVAQTDDHTVKLDMGQRHVIARSRHHLRQLVRRLLFLLLFSPILTGRARKTEFPSRLLNIHGGETGRGSVQGLPCGKGQAIRRSFSLR
jgi:hypothetical protein